MANEAVWSWFGAGVALLGLRRRAGLSSVRFVKLLRTALPPSLPRVLSRVSLRCLRGSPGVPRIVLLPCRMPIMSQGMMSNAAQHGSRCRTAWQCRELAHVQLSKHTSRFLYYNTLLTTTPSNRSLHSILHFLAPRAALAAHSIMDVRTGLQVQHICGHGCTVQLEFGNLYRCNTSGLVHICDSTCNQRLYYDVSRL